MDVIATARELGKAIQQDERFIRMMAAQQTNDDDEQLQKLIGDFNLKRVDLNSEVSKAERDQEKVARLIQEPQAGCSGSCSTCGGCH